MKLYYNKIIYANMSEMVDETGSNPVANKRESSSLSVGIWCRSHLIQIKSDGCYETVKWNLRNSQSP